MRSWLAKRIILLNGRDLVSCDKRITRSFALQTESRRQSPRGIGRRAVMARTITVTIEKSDGNEEVVVTVDDDVAEDSTDDLVEYYRRRLPLTVKAMGL